MQGVWPGGSIPHCSHMAEVYNNKICVSLQDLDGIVSYDAIKKMQQRGNVERASRGCRNTSALYYLDSLPYRYKVEVYKRYPDLQS